MKFYKKKTILIVTIAVSVLVILLILSTAFALFNVNSNKVIAGISVNNIKINGLTRKQAEEKINKELEEKLDKEIVVKTDGFEYTLKLNQIEANYAVENAVEEAYNTGRNGNIFSNNLEIIKTMVKGKNINLGYEYNEKLLDDMVLDIALKIPDAVVEPSYYIEDNTLIINRGKPGNTIDKEKVKNQIIDVLKKENADLNILLDVVKAEPEDINIEKIHEEVYKEPKNAYYTKDPFQIYAHEDGIDFNVDEAKKLLDEYKEEYEIKLVIIHPEITTAELGTEAFPDMLSTFSTKYDQSNIPRSTNLVLAMNKLDGTVVNPGEVFSYNKTLGKRTAEAGYKEAGGFSGGRTVQMLAGGICQISSTLYDAAVYANMEIVERHNHMFLAGYVGAGKDATVVYGSLDFKFKNTRKYPIMIKTSIGSGVAKISIFGIKEDVEYEVEISTDILSYSNYSVIYEDDSSLAPGQQRVAQNGMNGCKSITYKILKLNGKQVSSTVLSTDTYDPMNKIIKRGVQQDVQTSSEPQTEPAVAEEEPPTVQEVAPVEEPTNAPEPEQNNSQEIQQNPEENHE